MMRFRREISTLLQYDKWLKIRLFSAFCKQYVSSNKNSPILKGDAGRWRTPTPPLKKGGSLSVKPGKNVCKNPALTRIAVSFTSCPGSSHIEGRAIMIFICYAYVASESCSVHINCTKKSESDWMDCCTSLTFVTYPLGADHEALK